MLTGKEKVYLSQGGTPVELDEIAKFTNGSGAQPSTTAPAALASVAAVGTSANYARADHVHAIPGASAGAVRGTVLIQPAIANLTAAPTQTDFNNLLAALRLAGVIASS
ncbi:hypothetical protein [Burkholderia gladioli]|uniref:hypothetical protein n=1 Tax=Burkholderia gladioli TaxID=28095 RepID=UPI0016422BFA|nr:hypothetical protein [Burkholderia gladioli]